MPRTIVISIVDFNLFDCTEFYSFFQPLEATRHTLLSDKMGFQFFELKKLPDNIDERDSLLLRLSLFKANTEEELEKIRAMEVPEMERAINAYYTITASEKFRELERLRSNARHDEAQALHHAKQEGKAEGRAEGEHIKVIEIARNLFAVGMPHDQSASATGLTYEEIEKLRTESKQLPQERESPGISR